jgi:hypothetical protein
MKRILFAVVLTGISCMLIHSRVSRGFDPCMISGGCDMDPTVSGCTLNGSGGITAAFGQEGTLSTGENCGYATIWYFVQVPCGYEEIPGFFNCTA